MGTNTVKIGIFEDYKQAPVYGKEYKYLEVDRAVIVRKGTEEGNATVDLVLIGKDGEKYTAMVTGHILQMIAELIHCNKG